MTCLLQRTKHHDLDERADMQAVRGAVKSDIGRDDLLRGPFIQTFDIGCLVDVSARGEQRYEL
jgi:hypothetical protein